MGRVDAIPQCLVSSLAEAVVHCVNGYMGNSQELEWGLAFILGVPSIDSSVLTDQG